MHRTLIVARMTPGTAGQVAAAFADSDRTELPALVGVVGRSLFGFHDLYLDLIESDREPAAALAGLRDHPLFTDINTKIGPHISAYYPDWREPADAMAGEFYRWQRR